MEAWDGPASVCFTDGTVIGAVLDRNGLRPRASGSPRTAWSSSVRGRRPDIDHADVVAKLRLQPGKMFLVDTAQAASSTTWEIKDELAAEHPYQEWLDDNQIHLSDLPAPEHIHMSHKASPTASSCLRLHQRGLEPVGEADGRHRRRGDRLDGHRHPGRGPVLGSLATCCSTTSSSCSRR